MREQILQWLMNGRVGASSKAMATHLCGLRCDGSYPLDPGDLNRCLLFLQDVPEARAELPKMATVNKVWAALVERWSEIEAMFLAEVGLDWCKAESAPKTYKLMQKAIEAGRQAMKAGAQ